MYIDSIVREAKSCSILAESLIGISPIKYAIVNELHNPKSSQNEINIEFSFEKPLIDNSLKYVLQELANGYKQVVEFSIFRYGTSGDYKYKAQYGTRKRKDISKRSAEQLIKDATPDYRDKFTAYYIVIKPSK